MGCSPSTPRSKECINVTAMRTSYNTQVEKEKEAAENSSTPPDVVNVNSISVISTNTNQPGDLPNGANTNGEKVRGGKENSLCLFIHLSWNFVLIKCTDFGSSHYQITELSM